MIYSRHPDIAWRQVVDEMLVVDPRNGKIYPLNPVSSFIWESLDGTKDLKAIEEAIQKQFEVSQEEATKDLTEFIEQLEQAELIQTQ